MQRNDGSAREPGIDQPRREVIKKAAYVVPAILSLKAVPSFASVGSEPVSAPAKGNGSRPARRGGPHKRKSKGNGNGPRSKK